MVINVPSSILGLVGIRSKRPYKQNRLPDIVRQPVNHICSTYIAHTLLYRGYAVWQKQFCGLELIANTQSDTAIETPHIETYISVVS